MLAYLFLGACAFGGDPEVASTEHALTGEIAPTDSVGSLPGGLSVDFDGQANYSIPIEVPPARAGHVPSLGFSYSSSDAVGALGRGWSLSGFSAITRCAQSIAIDGAYRAVAYDEEDAFCLDGARLVEVGRVGSAREFRTERESFARIFAYPESGVSGPSSWEVRRPDGTVALYGKGGAKSRTRISTEARYASWLVGLVRDAFGNLIEFEYQANYPTDPSLEPSVTGARGLLPEVSIERVRYGSHESGFESTAEVSFEYEERPDIRSGHTAGLTWNQTRRLARVHTHVGSKTFRTYHLDYETTGATGASRLVSIQDCVEAPRGPAATEIRDGKVCRPATTFEWEVGDLDAENEVVARRWRYENLTNTAYFGAVTGMSSWTQSNPILTLDFDGDGMDDVGYVVQNNLVMHLSSNDFELQIIHDNAVDIAAEGRQYDVLDYNLDGRDDLGFFSVGSAVAAGELDAHLTYTVALSTGDGISIVSTSLKRSFGRFYAAAGSLFWPLMDDEIDPLDNASYMSAANEIQPGQNNSFWRIADFNGDGAVDLLGCEVLSRRLEETTPATRCPNFAEHWLWGEGWGAGIPAHCPGELTLQSLDGGSHGDRRIGVGAVCRNAHNPMLGAIVADFTGDGVADLLYMDALTAPNFWSAGTIPIPTEDRESDSIQWTQEESPPSWKVL
ncbi:MAG: hypothetical protein KC586_24140, partial [Myxococcales bacterium]|nr:hypothetical protein [Myxococcales bacterium]